MANVKITDLTAYTDAASTDVLPVVDVTNDVTKKISIANLLKAAPLGSAAAPGIAFDGDPNTGVYSPGADQVAISTNSVGRVFVDASGRVGVGVSSPQSLFHVDGDATAIRVTRGSAIGFAYNTGTAATDPFRIQSNGGAVDLLSPASQPITLSAGGSEKVRVTSAGLVGIGTSSPSELLHLSGGDIAFSSSQNRSLRVLTGGASEAGGSLTLEAGSSGPGSNGSDAGQLIIRAGNGYDGLGTFQRGDILLYAGANAYTNDYHGSIRFFTASGAGTTSEKIRIDSSGRLGIGSTGPSQRLTVKSAGGANGAVGVEASANDSTLLIYNDGSSHILNATYSSTGSYQPISFYTNGVERARVTTAGQWLVGTSTARDRFYNNGPNQAIRLQVEGGDSFAASLSAVRNSNDSDAASLVLAKARSTGYAVVQSEDRIGRLSFQAADGTNFAIAANIEAFVDATPGSGDMPGRLVFSTTADGASSPTERMRIRSNGSVYIGSDPANGAFFGTGTQFSNAGGFTASVSGGSVAFINRQTNDGTLIDFAQDQVTEGTISVSGTTVSYNGAHLSRWSQLPSGDERTEILRGSVLSNIDEMCEWGEEDNEQLNRMKVSDIEGDPNVSGVFQAWDDDDDTYTNDFYCAMTGDFIIRIGAGVTVDRGDLLMSAGDGTAKPQDDDIIRSKTIAKVTSTNVSCTYEDGSYCVPCVLMAC